MYPLALPQALTGKRRDITDDRVGHLSWYESGPESGSPSGQPLLLVHSVNAAASAYEVKPLYERYARERPVYALDLPGFGFSDRSDRAYTPRLMTDAIHAMLAEIRRQHGSVQVDGLAVSLSTEFLSRAAVESPGAFRSLAFVSPTGFDRRELRVAAEGSTLGRAWILSLLKALGQRRPLFELLTRRRSIRHFLRKAWGSEYVDAGLLDYAFATSRPAGAEFAPLQFVSGFLFSGDSGTVYRTLAEPVWAVHGVRGDFVDYRSIHLMAERPNWRVKVLPTGALPHFEGPNEFCRYYDAWSASLPLRPALAAASPRHKARLRIVPADAEMVGRTADA